MKSDPNPRWVSRTDLKKHLSFPKKKNGVLPKSSSDKEANTRCQKQRTKICDQPELAGSTAGIHTKMPSSRLSSWRSKLDRRVILWDDTSGCCSPRILPKNGVFRTMGLSVGLPPVIHFERISHETNHGLPPWPWKPPDV